MKLSATVGIWILTLGALLLFSVDVAEAKRKEGDIVLIRGQVIDGESQPISGVTVVLEASHSYYSVLRRQRIVDPALRQTGTVDEHGRFEIEWHWDRHYNEFGLSVGLEVTRGGTPGFEILSHMDLTDRMLRDIPIQVTLTVKRAGYVRWLKRYLADRATADEEKIYREMGRPDRIKDEDTDSSWWYFKLGKAYRFEHGTLDQVIHFTPASHGPAVTPMERNQR